MDAYNVKLVDDNGEASVDDPKVRLGLISALVDYTGTYTRGCTPTLLHHLEGPRTTTSPSTNKTIVMTHSFTISIAAKWLDDANNPALTPKQRAAGKKAYGETIIAASFPNEAGRLADQIPLRTSRPG